MALDTIRSGVVAIATVVSGALGFTNGRHIDRTQNGVEWLVIWNGVSGTASHAIEFYYRANTNQPWTEAVGMRLSWLGTASTYSPQACIFIDLDDNLHVMVKDRSTGNIWYRRATPDSAARTSYTWGAAAFNAAANTAAQMADFVVHRNPAGAGWHLHLVYSLNLAGANYRRCQIAADGTQTWAAAVSLITTGAVPVAQTSPSIDFRHTGDAKTVKDGVPDLYVSWQMGQSGTTGAWGHRYRAAAYSAPGGVPTWTFGNERTLDQTYRLADNEFDWINVLFDGDATVYVGGVLIGVVASVTARRFVLYAISAADDTVRSKVVELNLPPISGCMQLRPSGGGLTVVGYLFSSGEVQTRRYTPAGGIGAAVGRGNTAGRVAVARRRYTSSPVLLEQSGTDVKVDTLLPSAGAWRWNGAAWVAESVHVADAVGFVTLPARWWNGAAWVDGPTPLDVGASPVL